MTNVPDLLEQMTWAINQGGPNAGGGGTQAVYEFLSNIGRVVWATPKTTTPPRTPVGPYAPDLIPFMQQIAWEANDKTPNREVEIFLSTISYYFSDRAPSLAHWGPYFKPTFAPPPTAVQYLPLNDIPSLLQVAYWLLNEGSNGNPKAWAFLQALAHYLFQTIRTTFPGKWPYPT